MGCDKHPFTLHHPILDLLLKIGNGPRYRILETFGKGHQARIDVPVGSLQGGIPRIGKIQRRRTDIKGTSPNLHLLLTIFVCSLTLVQTLQGSVMPLIEFPALDDG